MRRAVQCSACHTASVSIVRPGHRISTGSRSAGTLYGLHRCLP
ncbi:hypothetical protein F750_3601 [Streptomyces sp. PAMC 26508]|nr:hypothetical protein F750_3601 [Streptomyces sp. PAMC 26508]